MLEPPLLEMRSRTHVVQEKSSTLDVLAAMAI
jgi:hypothetical protein